MTNNTSQNIVWEGTRYRTYKRKSDDWVIENKVDSKRILLRGRDAVEFSDYLEVTSGLELEFEFNLDCMFQLYDTF